MIEYAAIILRRHMVGTDGRTVYERLKGRGDRRRVIEFGEKVLYKSLKRPEDPGRPLDARFVDGIYLGVMDISGEIVVGVGEEVVRGQEARRVTEDTRWDPGLVKAIKATAVQPNPGQTDLRIRSHIRATDGGAPAVPPALPPREGNHEARQMYLRKSDFEGEHGAG